jgi:hypothetical protein
VKVHQALCWFAFTLFVLPCEKGYLVILGCNAEPPESNPHPYMQTLSLVASGCAAAATARTLLLAAGNCWHTLQPDTSGAAVLLLAVGWSHPFAGK